MHQMSREGLNIARRGSVYNSLVRANEQSVNSFGQAAQEAANGEIHVGVLRRSRRSNFGSGLLKSQHSEESKSRKERSAVRDQEEAEDDDDEQTYDKNLKKKGTQNYTLFTLRENSVLDFNNLINFGDAFHSHQLKQGSNPQRNNMPSNTTLKDLSSVIQQLESQNICGDGEDVDMTSLQHQAPAVNLTVKANELQEQMQLYERLQMKNEFLYSMRMYVMSLLSLGDMLRLRELLIEYKFVLSFEDERMFEIANKGGSNYRMSAESAFNNVIQLIQGINNANEDGDVSMNNPHESKKGNVNGTQIIERHQQLICGSLDKKAIFQQAIMPVLKTVCITLGCDVKEYVSQLMQVIFAHDQQQCKQEAQHQPQVMIQLPQVSQVMDQISQTHMLAQISPQLPPYERLPSYPLPPASSISHLLLSNSATQFMPHAPQQHLPQQLPSIHNVFSAAFISGGGAGSANSQKQQQNFPSGSGFSGDQQQQY